MIRFLQGDCAEVLQTLQAESVHAVVTSPPYFALRSYLPNDHTSKHAEIGTEATPAEFVAKLVAVFREVKRVLRKDGTCFIVIGSSYCQKVIYSNRLVLSKRLSIAERSEVFKALSSVWAGYASPEQALSKLLSGRQEKTGELSASFLREVREAVRGAQVSRAEGSRKMLLGELRETRQHEQEGRDDNLEVPILREGCEQTPIGNGEEQDKAGILQQRLLVQLQSGGQPLPMGGRSVGKDEQPLFDLAEGCSGSRQVSMQTVPQYGEAGGASHSSVQVPQGRAMGSDERDSSMQELSQEDRSERDRVGRGPIDNSRRGVVDLAIEAGMVPNIFKRWMDYEYIIKPKDDIGIPWMLATALRDDGWWLRSECIWHKANPLPESCRDRPTRSHEQIFMLTKSARYFWDSEAVKEPNTINPNWHYSSEDYKRQIDHSALKTDGDFRRPKSSGKGFSGFAPAGPNGNGRNLRSVWTLSSESFPGKHYAVFPTKLVTTCISAGTSERGVCPHCSAPWVRVVERTPASYFDGKAKGPPPTLANPVRFAGGPIGNGLGVGPTKTLGFRQSCSCPLAAPIPATVLDPFAGSGTTGLVADRMQRNAILIDISNDYERMARERIHDDAPLFAQVT